ncbi:hypothetical protein BK660_02340 [Pseudomonas brassicacearum]|uniref:Uncharacterized protein n=2 Tax=Pseudomonas brassicacearum TaxID=930166 RepID=A0A423IGF3_9PSED|nr:hypothetical protein BK660_02340 [Pseudomonas brassicacearum]
MAPGYWLAAALATILIVLSLDLGHEHTVYRVSITPVAGQEGDVRLVLFGKSYEQYLTERKLDVPDGWQVTQLVDATILQSAGPVKPLVITTEDEPVRVFLLRHPQGAIANISNEAGSQQEVVLKAPAESFWPLVVGGPESTLAYSIKAPIYHSYWFVAAAVVFSLLAFIALRITRKQCDELTVSYQPRGWEIVAIALPLLLSTGVTLLAFFPGNVSYDGSLQWVQAAERGELTATIGYPTTYLMRLFTFISNSPLPLLVFQSSLAALGVALVLHELRYRGVPFFWTFIVVLAMALTPQYPTFFTGLGKDALCTMGMLFFIWTLLALFRQTDKTRPSPRLLIAFVGWGLFAGLMRFNAMPVILSVTILALALLFYRSRDRRLVAAGLMFLAGIFVLPQTLGTMAHRENYEYNQNLNEFSTDGLPLGTFATAYIYHLFGAAIATGIPIPAESSALFYSIAPREAWSTYDCNMTDTTFSGVNKGILLNSLDYADYLKKHQVEMLQAIIGLVRQHPDLLLQRQACITQVMWHTGFGQLPFQTTATLGYDNVDKRFLALAGESRSFWPQLRESLETYKKWTEGQYWFWLFWRPALLLGLGFFVVGIYIARTKDLGLLLVALVPLTSILLLLLIIPFPAYRYTYPCVLILTLLGTLAFSRLPSCRVSPGNLPEKSPPQTITEMSSRPVEAP